MVLTTRDDSLRDLPSPPYILNPSRVAGLSLSASTRLGTVANCSMSADAMVELTNGICWSMMIHAFSRHTFAFFSGLRNAAYVDGVCGGRWLTESE